MVTISPVVSNVAAHPSIADSCELPVHDLATMLPPNIAALPPVADSCGLPVYDLAIMSLLRIRDRLGVLVRHMYITKYTTRV